LHFSAYTVVKNVVKLSASAGHLFKARKKSLPPHNHMNRSEACHKF